MNKFMKQLELNRIGKATLAMVLAGTFTFSSVQVMASENTSENNNIEVVEAPKTDNQVNETSTTTVSTETTTEAVVEVKKPALVPGDLFYFAKVMIEKIQLILTTSDVKEAELLAKFASERLAEAEALFAQGNEELALKTIEKALTDMNAVNQVVAEKTVTDTTVVVEAEKEATEVKAPETVEAPKAENQAEAQIPVVEAPKNEEVKEVETLTAQNIIALTAAMEKVKNPVAKASLQRNIEKSQAKLAKKLAKVEQKVAKVEEQKVATTETKVETTTKVEAEPVKTETKVEAEVKVETKSTVVPSVKEVKAQEKKARTELKEEAKKQKQELKEKREEVKSEFKEVKAQVKEEKGNKGKSEEKRNDKN